jgi:hypothetical protein
MMCVKQCRTGRCKAADKLCRHSVARHTGADVRREFRRKVGRATAAEPRHAVCGAPGRTAQACCAGHGKEHGTGTVALEERSPRRASNRSCNDRTGERPCLNPADLAWHRGRYPRMLQAWSCKCLRRALLHSRTQTRWPLKGSTKRKAWRPEPATQSSGAFVNKKACRILTWPTRRHILAMQIMQSMCLRHRCSTCGFTCRVENLAGSHMNNTGT